MGVHVEENAPSVSSDLSSDSDGVTADAPLSKMREVLKTSKMTCDLENGGKAKATRMERFRIIESHQNSRRQTSLGASSCSSMEASAEPMVDLSDSLVLSRSGVPSAEEMITPRCRQLVSVSSSHFSEGRSKQTTTKTAVSSSTRSEGLSPTSRRRWLTQIGDLGASEVHTSSNSSQRSGVTVRKNAEISSSSHVVSQTSMKTTSVEQRVTAGRVTNTVNKSFEVSGHLKAVSESSGSSSGSTSGMFLSVSEDSSPERKKITSGKKKETTVGSIREIEKGTTSGVVRKEIKEIKEGKLVQLKTIEDKGEIQKELSGMDDQSKLISQKETDRAISSNVESVTSQKKSAETIEKQFHPGKNVGFQTHVTETVERQIYPGPNSVLQNQSTKIVEKQSKTGKDSSSQTQTKKIVGKQSNSTSTSYHSTKVIQSDSGTNFGLQVQVRKSAETVEGHPGVDMGFQTEDLRFITTPSQRGVTIGLSCDLLWKHGNREFGAIHKGENKKEKVCSGPGHNFGFSCGPGTIGGHSKESPTMPTPTSTFSGGCGDGQIKLKARSPKNTTSQKFYK